MRFHRMVPMPGAAASPWQECWGDCRLADLWEHAQFQPPQPLPAAPQPPTQLELIDREIYGEKGKP